MFAVVVAVEVGAGAAKDHHFRVELDAVGGGAVNLRQDDAVDDDGIVHPTLFEVPPSSLQDCLLEIGRAHV